MNNLQKKITRKSLKLSKLTEAAKKAPKSTVAKKAPKSTVAKKAPKSTVAKKAPKSTVAKKAPKSTVAKKAPKSTVAKKAPKSTVAKKAPKSTVAKKAPKSTVAKKAPKSTVAKKAPKSTVAKKAPKSTVAKEMELEGNTAEQFVDTLKKLSKLTEAAKKAPKSTVAKILEEKIIRQILATSPVQRPTTSPVQRPTTSPVQRPTTSPVQRPTTSPVQRPTTSPVQRPTTSPVQRPTTSPVQRPTTSPVQRPTTSPVQRPTTSPVQRPIVSRGLLPSGFNFAVQTVSKNSTMPLSETIQRSNQITSNPSELESHFTVRKTRNNTVGWVAGIIAGIIIVSVLGMSGSPSSQAALFENFIINPINNNVALLDSAPVTKVILSEAETSPDISVDIHPTMELPPPEELPPPKESSYSMVNDVHVTLVFKFRDGVETHDFPVFKMTTDFVSNIGTSFKVQGVVKESPHLYKALDDSFKYREMLFNGVGGFDYNYRFFDITANISTLDETIDTIDYRNCEVLSHRVNTENDDYESYGFYDVTGFAVVNEIEFRCAGMSFNDMDRPVRASIPADKKQNQFKFAEDTRAFVTFKFDDGLEKVEFPIFELTTGFAEKNNAGPSFHVEDIVMNKHVLLDNAINAARSTGNLQLGHNTDFEVTVEFVNNGESVRGLEFNDCRVSKFLIDTYQDKEEGYTGKRGFALMEKIDFTCAGMKPQNPLYENIKGDSPVWSSVKIENEYIKNPYNMGTGPHAVAIFKFDEGVETIDFPIFKQVNLLTRANPSFELVGIPGQYPLLYNAIDNEQKGSPRATGTNQQTSLFDVDVNLMYGNNAVRGFSYADCRSTDYVVKTQHDKEESFYKGFALTNEFHFECQGYDPNNSILGSK